MTLTKLIRLVREIAHADPYSVSWLIAKHPTIQPGVVREATARGLVYSPPPDPKWGPSPMVVRLTPAGLRWCRLHPEPRRKVRVWRCA